MKNILSITMLALLCAASCKKENKNEDQLPPATQTGANTFGCLVNGKVFIPKGLSGTGSQNYRGVYEIFTGRPYLKLIAAQYINNDFQGEMYFSIDSFYTIGTYPLRRNKNRIVYGGKFFNSCGISGFDTSTYQFGQYNIIKHDVILGIFAGTFSGKIKPTNCDTINITEGRFDIKL